MIMINKLLLKNKLTPENSAAILKQENSVSKTDIIDFVKKTDFDNKLISHEKKLTRIKQNMYLLKMN